MTFDPSAHTLILGHADSSRWHSNLHYRSQVRALARAYAQRYGHAVTIITYAAGGKAAYAVNP